MIVQTIYLTVSVEKIILKTVKIVMENVMETLKLTRAEYVQTLKIQVNVIVH